jgi:hypothetical protein
MHDPAAVTALHVSRRQMYGSDSVDGNCGMCAWSSQTVPLYLGKKADFQGIALALAHQIHLLSTWSLAVSVGITSAGTRTDSLRIGGPLVTALEASLKSMGERVVTIPVNEARAALTGDVSGGKIRYIEAPAAIPYGRTVSQRKWGDAVKGYRYPRAMSLASAMAVARRILWDERLDKIRNNGARQPAGR